MCGFRAILRIFPNDCFAFTLITIIWLPSEVMEIYFIYCHISTSPEKYIIINVNNLQNNNRFPTIKYNFFEIMYIVILWQSFFPCSRWKLKFSFMLSFNLFCLFLSHFLFPYIYLSIWKYVGHFRMNTDVSEISSSCSMLHKLKIQIGSYNFFPF